MAAYSSVTVRQIFKVGDTNMPRDVPTFEKSPTSNKVELCKQKISKSFSYTIRNPKIIHKTEINYHIR